MNADYIFDSINFSGGCLVNASVKIYVLDQ